ncbi:pectate lyase Pel-34K [Verticillium dahliae]
MKYSALLALIPSAFASVVPRQDPCQASADGFASLNGGTTGGAGGTVVTVSTLADLEKYAAAAGPHVIKVEGRITVVPFGKEVSVSSDKTIVGVGEDAEIFQGGLRLIKVSNVIIRNLIIGHSSDGTDNDYDGIQSDTSSNIWIDHCLFEEAGDGLVDLRKDTNYFTVSNNIFRKHDKAFGIGWTENVVARGTIHHNWFDSTNQRNPSADNLAEAHLYNNFVSGVTSYGHYARGATTAVIENVFFENTKNPITRDEGAALRTKGNIFEGTDGTIAKDAGVAFDPASYYSYTLTKTADVPAFVRGNAGPRKEKNQEKPGPPYEGMPVAEDIMSRIWQ